MKFRLHYRGPLASNGGPKAKQAIRRYFHPQLKDLWTRPPLATHSELFLSADPELGVIRQVGGKAFSSVISATHFLVCELNICLLRPEDPGSLVTQGGDLDNRMKTLLDALSIPKDNQMPTGDAEADEYPFHCLLEDDNLVTGLSVSVDRLLGPSQPSEVLALIEVRVAATRGTFKNLGMTL